LKNCTGVRLHFAGGCVSTSVDKPQGHISYRSRYVSEDSLYICL